MKISQKYFAGGAGFSLGSSVGTDMNAGLVLVFAATELLKDREVFEALRGQYPEAHLCGCSTSGEIYNAGVFDDTLVATAVSFEHTGVMGASITLNAVSSSYEAGALLARSIDMDRLVHVFVLSDGLNVNGSELARGLTDSLPEGVTVTGGLAGNADRFEETYVFWDKPPAQNTLAIVGFYGDRLKVGCGSMGGWDPFGPERVVTRSSGNVLFELDGKSALELYKNYLGDHAEQLPAAGLLFPLSIRTGDGEEATVRTILAVNEQESSMTFAGDIPEGSYARLMKANFERLIDGAHGAAVTSSKAIDPTPAELAILISCVGRKLVLKQRVEEEIETAREVLGPGTILTGFYSYGEISPFVPGAKCALHNQTMTVTTMSEG